MCASFFLKPFTILQKRCRLLSELNACLIALSWDIELLVCLTQVGARSAVVALAPSLFVMPKCVSPLNLGISLHFRYDGADVMYRKYWLSQPKNTHVMLVVATVVRGGGGGCPLPTGRSEIMSVTLELSTRISYNVVFQNFLMLQTRRKFLFLWCPDDHYSVNKTAPLNLKPHPVDMQATCFFNIHYSITMPFTPRYPRLTRPFNFSDILYAFFAFPMDATVHITSHIW
jgi:hypothetical protein